MTDLSQYTIVMDGTPWEKSFGAVWEPIFKPSSTDVVAPVQTPKGWTLAMNGKPIWKYFTQVWKQKYGPDGRRLAAVVATDVGKWTVAVDGSPWNTVYNQMVLSPIFSPDGQKIAAVVKNNNRWTVSVDGAVWPETFDNVWDPVFSPAVIISRQRLRRTEDISSQSTEKSGRRITSGSGTLFLVLTGKKSWYGV